MLNIFSWQINKLNAANRKRHEKSAWRFLTSKTLSADCIYLYSYTIKHLTEGTNLQITHHDRQAILISSTYTLNKNTHAPYMRITKRVSPPPSIESTYTYTIYIHKRSSLDCPPLSLVLHHLAVIDATAKTKRKREKSTRVHCCTHAHLSRRAIVFTPRHLVVIERDLALSLYYMYIRADATKRLAPINHETRRVARACM